VVSEEKKNKGGKVMIEQLSPAIKELLLGAGANYSGGLAVSITCQLLEAVGRKTAKKFKPAPQQKALNTAMALALHKTAQSLGLENDAMFHFLKVFGAWIEREPVATELSQLIDPRPDSEPEMDELRQEFMQIGFAAEKLAGELAFNQVVGTFVEHFSTTAAVQPELQNQIQIGLLRQVTEKFNQQIAQGAEQTNLLRKIKNGVAPDMTSRLRAYLQRLANQNQYLPLLGLDTRAADATACTQSPMPLDRVYIQLDTTAKDERTGKKGEQRLAPQDEVALTALNALIRHSAIVLLGDPGGGKSTFINHLSLCLARHQLEPQAGWLEHLPAWPQNWSHLIPVPVILRDLGVWIKQCSPELTKGGLLLAYLKHWLKLLTLEELYDTIAQKLKDGHALLLIDGLDEVAVQDQQHHTVIEMIDDLIEAFAQTPKLVTCRILSYQDKHWQLTNKKWARFELAKLSRTKIEAFILAWFRQLSQAGEELDVDAKRTKLNDAVQRPDLLDLARNPLLLTVMAILHTHRGELPDARAKLYEEVVDLLLMHWEKTKVRDFRGQEIAFRQLLDSAKLQEIDFKHALWKIAFDAHGQKQTAESKNATANIAETTLLKAFKALPPEDNWNWAAQMINVIKHRAGLLVEDPPESYSFPHRTFQEFLAGCHLSSLPDFIDQTKKLAGQGAFWWEVVLLSVGRLVHNQGDVDRPLMLVVELSPADALHKEDTAAWRMIWLAGKVLIEIGLDRARRRNLGSTVVKKIRNQLIELIDYAVLEPRERADAAAVLGALGDLRAGVGIKEGLPDIEWCRVAKGPFLMGSDPDQDEHSAKDEQEQFECRLIRQEFLISCYPITCAQYRCFIDAGGYDQHRFWTKTGWQWRCDNDILRPETYGGVFATLNHPQVGVSWYEAAAFCNWLSDNLGARISLPTEAQWERAARHTDGRIYPWGSEYKEGCLNTFGSGIDSTSAVGIFPTDAAECGAMDMAGNVWEWCCSKRHSDYADYEKRVDDDPEGDNGRVLRGGCWVILRSLARCAYRNGNHPYSRNNLVGFRCVRT
jgi:formylglycine-generating enzyme required for sulfatase activity/energy-coupling factor transporter ATP-binding protein EcfA2